MATGKPVTATPRGRITVRFTPSEAEAMHSLLSIMLNNPDLPDYFGQNGEKTVRALASGHGRIITAQTLTAARDAD